MGQYEAEQASSSTSWQGALLSAWVSGVLVLQVPFQLHWKLGNGGFGYNLLFGLAAILAGILALSGITQLIKVLARGDQQLDRRLRIGTTWFLGLAAAAFAAALVVGRDRPAFAFYLGLGLVGAWVLYSVSAFLRSASRAPEFPLLVRLRKRVTAAARQPWPFNGIFWALVFLALIAKDLYSVSDIKGATTLETLLMVCGRLVTNAAFTLGLVISVQALLALTPRILRWVILVAASLIPFVTIASFSVSQLWNKGLTEVLNDFTASGRFDLEQELAASGLDISAWQAGLLCVATLAACFGIFLLLQRLSTQLIRCRLSTVPAMLIFSLIWFFAIAEQGLSMATKRTEIWQKEHRVFGVHMGLFTPPPGLETIPVEVQEPQSVDRTEELLASATSIPALERRPDIYILMVESWRSDSIDERVTPFLYRFANTDCQQFGKTFAGSNCTPLSWFTLFHSRLALHWADTVKGAETQEGLPGAYPIRLLKKLGYTTSVRAVCDLNYKNLGQLNFGTDHRLADSFVDSKNLPDEFAFPEREMLIVEELKQQVRQSQDGGHLHFIAFDSPHYNYYWPEKDYDPLNDGCEGSINYTHINPSPEKIEEVRMKYANAVHWMDDQISDFVGFLKEEGRYDDATIIITGDHGEEFQEHGSWFHCSTLKREQTEVPILIKWPSWLDTPPSQRQVSHLDIMPSVLDMLGLEDRYLASLSGHSTLREDHPGETVISTIHRGTTNVGVCIVKDGTKANFTFRGLWEGGLPDTLYLANYTDLDDKPISFLEELGDRSHTEFLRERYPDTTSRFFKSFGEPVAEELKK